MATAWVPRLDPESGYYYYFQASSGVTTWDRPLDYEPRRDDFEERWDEMNEAPYYYDKVLGEAWYCRETRKSLTSVPIYIYNPD